VTILDSATRMVMSRSAGIARIASRSSAAKRSLCALHNHQAQAMLRECSQGRCVDVGPAPKCRRRYCVAGAVTSAA